LEPDLIPLVRFVHVVLAAFWVGGDVFFFLLVNPTLRAMGPSGEGFAWALLRRGGFGRILFPIATITILAGAFLYYALGYHTEPFAEASRAVLTFGAILAVAAYVAGLVYFLPRERAMVRIGRSVGPEGPTPEQSRELQRIASNMEGPSKVAVTVLALAFLLMVGRTLV
jgi:uncharacterized membrane protein